MLLSLKEELGLDNVMEVPRITKITINMGVGEAIGDKKVLEHAVNDLEKIAGQKVVVLKRVNQLLALKFVKIGLLVVKLLCVVSVCMNF